MKNIFLFFFTLTLASGIYAQDTTTSQSTKADTLIIPEKKRPFLFAEVNFGAITNSASTLSAAKFLTQDFLNQQDKDDLVAPVGSFLRYGFMREASVGYREPWYKVFDTYQLGQGITLRNTYYNTARVGKDLLQLIMYGNKAYAHQTLSLDGSANESWYFSSIDYHFDVLIDSVQPVSFSISMHVGHDHHLNKVNTGSLYTEPNGAYLDLDLDYRLRSNTLDQHPLAGIGVGIGVNTAFRLSDNEKLVVDLRDLGLMNWHQGQLLDTDTNFRFRGLRFENIFSINDSITGYTNDRYTKSFLYENEGNYMVALPFYASLAYKRTFKNRSLRALSLQADYRYLTGFFPRLTFAADIKTGFRQSLRLEASSGGFNWFGLNARYEFTFARLWTLRVEIRNLNGLILPNVFGGAIGSLNLRYQL